MLKNYKSKLTSMKGFTLLELIIVIAIIGILAVLVLPNFATALAKARDSSRVSELSGLKTNLLLFSQENDGYFPMGGTFVEDKTTPANCIGLGCITSYKIDNRLPLRVNKTAVLDPSMYNYVGIGCTAGKGCVAYQLWTQLETKNAALNNDSDVEDNAALVSRSVMLGGALVVNGAGGNTVMDGDPAGANNAEACSTRNPGGVDCIFDLLP